MKKILYAISTMALLLCACSGDEKKEMPIDMPSISIVEQFLNDNNLYPNNKEEINSIDKLFIWDNHKVLLGQKKYNGWICKFDSNGKEIFSFELPKENNWKYSHYNQNSVVLTCDNFTLLRGWYTNVENHKELSSYNYQEHLSTFDMNNFKEIDKLNYQGRTLEKDFNVYAFIGNDRYLSLVHSTLTSEEDKLHIIGDNGEFKYFTYWNNNKSIFFGEYLGSIYDKKSIMIFLTDEIVAPVTSSDNDKNILIPYKIINLKKWELVKEIGETEGLKPQGDHLGEEDIFYKMDTTYLDGKNIKYVYSEKKIESDPISGVKQDRLLNKYYYNIDIDNYKVTYMGKVD